MIFDHIVITVKNTKISKDFYTKVFLPLGVNFIKEEDGCVGFGINGKASFWLCEGEEVQKPMHIAFISPNRDAVDHFYKAAIEAGGHDNGEPGLRIQYQPKYYGAFIIDPDGHNIEAVCRV